MGFLDSVLDMIGKVMDSSVPAETVASEKPEKFGWRNAWLAVKADSAQTVISKLNITGAKACGWKDGLKKAEEHNCVFVAGPINGYVLVIGTTELADHLERLDGLAASFDELQFFGTHDIVDLQEWALYRSGVLVRRYSFLGERFEVLWDDGALTDAERELGMEKLPKKGEEGDDDTRWPGEEDVLAIAAKWSVDTTFSDRDYEPSTGYIGAWQ